MRVRGRRGFPPPREGREGPIALGNNSSMSMIVTADGNPIGS